MGRCVNVTSCRRYNDLKLIIIIIKKKKKKKKNLFRVHVSLQIICTQVRKIGPQTKIFMELFTMLQQKCVEGWFVGLLSNLVILKGSPSLLWRTQVEDLFSVSLVMIDLNVMHEHFATSHAASYVCYFRSYLFPLHSRLPDITRNSDFKKKKCVFVSILEKTDAGSAVIFSGAVHH